jgi:hypothetical protein
LSGEGSGFDSQFLHVQLSHRLVRNIFCQSAEHGFAHSLPI